MVGVAEKGSAFANFSVLTDETNSDECAELMRNMARLFSHVVDRCDDDQIAKYDEVLCQLADIVEIEARADVAKLLAPLNRAPGSVVIKLANDKIEVAESLLEFSSVLSDDDLIEIVQAQTNEHRFAIAGRHPVNDRVGTEIVKVSDQKAILRLVENKDADIGSSTGARLLEKATGDSKIAASIGGRKDVDWRRVQLAVSAAGKRAAMQLSETEARVNNDSLEVAQTIAMNRVRNDAGFDATQWKVAWGQVKAMADRRQFNVASIERFCRYGYRHHVASSLAILLRINPEVLIKWLATQDTGALIVAVRAMNFKPDTFQRVFAALPWRDKVQPEDAGLAAKRYATLSQNDAHDIFEMWRAHSFSRQGTASTQQTLNVA